MSIQAALASALSSLAAEQRQALVISNNIANASTPGFSKRDMIRSELLTAGRGSGVDSGTLVRATDAALTASSRQADGNEAYADRLTDILTNFTTAIGQPGDERSLSSALGAFRSAMTTLSAAPENAVAQGQALAAAQDLMSSFHDLDASIAEARVSADQRIAEDVDAVNRALTDLAEVDKSMARAAARGESTAEQEDRRDLLLSEISKRIPIRTFDNGPGRLIVTSDQGSSLYDGGIIHRLEFAHSPQINSEVRYGADASSAYTPGLSGVTVDGIRLRTSESGSLAASLKARDETLPRFTRMADEIAANLIESFQESDASLSAGQAGIFTDGGLARTAGDQSTIPGLARRITLNAAVDPDQGGEAWRLRDGAAAAAPGEASANGQVLDFLDSLEGERSYGSDTGLPPSMGLTRAAAQSAGLMQSERATWSSRSKIRTSLALEARTAVANKTGVNVDEEMQRLLLVQQTHAATVQVIRAAQEMLDSLMSIR